MRPCSIPARTWFGFWRQFPRGSGRCESSQSVAVFLLPYGAREGGRFEIGITLRNAARAKILLRLSARWSAGSRGEGALVLLSAARTVDRRRHQVHDADPILAALGLAAANPVWHPTLPAVLKDEGEAVLRTACVDLERAIGLAPATARGEGQKVAGSEIWRTRRPFAGTWPRTGRRDRAWRGGYCRRGLHRRGS